MSVRFRLCAAIGPIPRPHMSQESCFGSPLRRLPSLDVGARDFNVETFVRIRSLLDGLDLRYAPVRQDPSFMTPDGQSTMLSVRRSGAIEVRAITQHDEHLEFRVDQVVIATNSNQRNEALLRARPGTDFPRAGQPA